MNYLINLYNQVGAGPRNISLNLIAELRRQQFSNRNFYVIVPDFEEYHSLESAPGLTLIKLSRYESLWMKVLFRLYLDFIKLPQLVKHFEIGSVLAFGNFLLAPFKARKTVLLHHPYIFDDRQLARLGFFARCVERLKRLAFGMTLRNVDNVVVQSEYVLGELRKKWPWYRGGVHVIPNPVSARLGDINKEAAEAFIAQRRNSLQGVMTLLYVSRYYPHKNHAFLLALSRALQTYGMNHRILITIDSNIEGAASFLGQVEKSRLPITNLGEIEQTSLREYYASAHAMLFPSRSETFGNPLVEAMGFGLPVIAPDLEYAHAVLANTGIFYEEDSADHCAAQILALVQDTDRYVAMSHQARERFSCFPQADAWLQRYLDLI